MLLWHNQPASDGLIADLVAYCPKTIWIELTSKCPFDCVFCSRKHERGSGEHMSFALYQSLIAQLHRPEVIRLNYSGESMNYPHLSEAIRLANRSGALTELVSALASASHSAVQSLVDRGLHRLSVSIHSMEPDRFRAIYRHGEVSDIVDRLEYLRQYKLKCGSKYPQIDFAFVAMHDNLAQLVRIAEYARELGVQQISVHPVIRRSPILISFPRELDDAGNLRSDFWAQVQGEVAKVRAHIPGVSITIARSDTAGAKSHEGITTCEQNPWDTVHVLASGAVVVCEVQDRVEIGNLHKESLAEIWGGEAYREFRRRYLNGTHEICAACPWRRTLPLSPARNALIRGWHPSSGDTAEWSEASAVVAVQPGVAGVHLAGILPPAPNGSSDNTLEIRQGMKALTQIVNRSQEPLAFDAVVPTEVQRGARATVLRFETKHSFCPAERGQGSDLRHLGFALTRLALRYGAKRQWQVKVLLGLLENVERLSVFSLKKRRPTPGAPVVARSGVSVVIPARDTPELLASTLAAVGAALARIGEPSEIIVVVSGAGSSTCEDVRRSFPGAKWILRSEVLHFGAAVELGLTHTQHPWLYLLNSDMCLRPSALTEALKLRRWDTFAIGSRIRMQDGSNTETNWTDFRFCEGDAAELIERDPGDMREPKGCLYVGGGSGLFRASLLARFIKRTHSYAPFYWEDVEWGSLAWRNGYQCIFCPTSEAIHGHRQTVGRYYTESELCRVFERNRLQFHLRNLSGIRCLEKKLLSLDSQSWAELIHAAVLLDTFRARASAFTAPLTEDALIDRWKLPF